MTIMQTCISLLRSAIHMPMRQMSCLCNEIISLVYVTITQWREHNSYLLVKPGKTERMNYKRQKHTYCLGLGLSID